MALSFVSRIGASPLGRAGVAIFSILALAGAVQFGLPMACAAGAAFCQGDAPVEAVEALDQGLPDEPVAEAPVASPSTPSVPAATNQVALADIALPTISNNDLIASTFAALAADLTAQPPELTSRTVRTVAINADGTPASGPADLVPAAPLVADASASASSEPVGAEAPVQIVNSSVEATPTAASQEPASGEDSSLAYAPVSGDAASVTGKGANVRSLPQKGGSDVLFALRGGQEVTIVEMRQGWAKVVDQQGRSGWIYGEYLQR